MKLAIFGLTISSSWGNGHVTLWRGLCRALARAGHQAVFFERDRSWYANARDWAGEPGIGLVLYADWDQVRQRARSECDALFRAAPLVGANERVAIGLPDTVWFPADALATLPADRLAFLLFPVEQPQHFDAVLSDAADRVLEIRVKQPDPGTHWIWGAFAMPGRVFHQLQALWVARGRRDEYLGPLVNAWIAAGGAAVGCRAGEAYVDVGTLHGYRNAMAMLAERDAMTRQAPLSARATPQPLRSDTPHQSEGRVQ